MLLYLLIGFFTGLTSGMFGIGGGAIRIPLLYLTGIPLMSAFGINILVIPFSVLIGAISHRENIDFKISKLLIVGGLFGASIGALVIGFVSTLALAFVFVLVSILSVIGVYSDKVFPKLSKKINRDPKVIISGSFLITFFTIMRGGAGAALFPSFLKTIGLDMKSAIATSLFVAIFTSVVGVIVFYVNGSIIFSVAIWVVVGSLLGAWIGSRIALRTKNKWLELGFSIIIISFAILTLFKALT